MTRLAIVHRERCRPTACSHECKKCCPIEKKQQDTCIIIDGKAKIDETACNGCAICMKRCPFEAINIVNLPEINEKDLIFRYGENGFALYNLPVPKSGKSLGLLGRNGIGKSTAIEILAGKKEIDRDKFKGTELQKYFNELKEKKIAYKPQNLAGLYSNMPALELLKKIGSEKEIKNAAEKLAVENILNNKLNKLSGGELQKIAIIAASLREADIYFFDEPLAFLDISERLRVSEFINEIAKKGKEIVVVEHDILILDYLTEQLNIFYGQPGCFGLVSGVKSTRQGVNSYLSGFLKEENLRIRDKALSFNFTKNKPLSGIKLSEWPEFEIDFSDGEKFHLKVSSGEIHQNHVIGILGKNGTGKTSFVRALAGEIETSAGDLNLNLKISCKPQYLFTDSDESVRDIILKEKISKKISSAFNLGVLHNKKLKQLSGGELQRFSIARCLAKEADIYLIDEPSAYLDIEERISAAKEIKEIVAEKEKTAFVVDHDLLLMSYLADSLIVFSGAGRKNSASEIMDFEKGISTLLKELDITLRKEKESGRPRINKKGSVLDREQKSEGEWALL